MFRPGAAGTFFIAELEKLKFTWKSNFGEGQAHKEGAKVGAQFADTQF